MQDTAVIKLAGACNEADGLATKIAAYMADHMETTPDEINWGHVGTANAVVDKLHEIAVMLGL